MTAIILTRPTLATKGSIKVGEWVMTAGRGRGTIPATSELRRAAELVELFEGTFPLRMLEKVRVVDGVAGVPVIQKSVD